MSYFKTKTSEMNKGDPDSTQEKKNTVMFSQGSHRTKHYFEAATNLSEVILVINSS